MNKKLSIISILMAMFTALGVIGVAIYTLIYGVAMPTFENIVDAELFVNALIADSAKEIIFSLIIVVCSLIAFSRVGKVEKLKSLKGWHIFFIFAAALVIVYQLINNIAYLFEDLEALYISEFISLANVWAYAGVGICVVGFIAWILNIVSASKVNKLANDKENAEYLQMTNSGATVIDSDLVVFNNNSNGGLNINSTNSNKTPNNDLAVLLGLAKKEPAQMNTNLENIVNQTANGDRVDKSEISAEQRKEKLREQIGAEKLKYAKMKAKEYKAKLDSGEFTQAEFEVLMTALKKELLNK